MGANDKQFIECTNLLPDKEHFFKLRFTDLLGNRYNTRAIVIEPHSETVTETNKAKVGTAYTKASSKSIQTALESLPNFAIPKVEVTTATDTPVYDCSKTEDKCFAFKKKEMHRPKKGTSVRLHNRNGTEIRNRVHRCAQLWPTSTFGNRVRREL